MSARAWAASLAAVTVACAPTAIEPDPSGEPLRAPIVDGTADTGDPAVVALIARRARCVAPDPALLCTGTLIAPRVVLTAAHCLDVFGADGEYEVLFGDSLQDPDAAFAPVVRAVLHPGFDPATHRFDLALLLLAAPVAITPVPLPSRALGSTDVGAAARAVGFGVTKDAAAPVGVKRSGDLVIASIAGDAFVATPAPSMSCTGDSGGPVFVSRDGAEELLGVTASGDPGCAREAFNVRVDVAVDGFIQPFLDAAAEAPAVGAPSAQEVRALCGGGCTRHEDCPAALRCEKDEHGTGRCLSRTLREGDFLEACTTDAQCASGACARVWTDACRCFEPCAAPPGFGCSASPAAIAWAALAVVLVRGVRRRRAR